MKIRSSVDLLNKPNNHLSLWCFLYMHFCYNSPECSLRLYHFPELSSLSGYSFCSLFSLKWEWQLQNKHNPCINKVPSWLSPEPPNIVEASVNFHMRKDATVFQYWKWDLELSPSLLLYLACNYHVKKGPNNVLFYIRAWATYKSQPKQ